MQTQSYVQRRGQLEAYFDRTAAEAWAKLTSDGPVSRIRATVRAGRDRMRGVLLSGMPDDLTGCRLLDAGCGTGALAVEAARRGADVVAIDISSTLVGLAETRAADASLRGSLTFRVGDMLDPSLGRFDYVVAMDSLIHYRAPDMVEMVARLASAAEDKVLFTFAPRTPLLTVMHLVGRLFPRRDRAPMLEPVSLGALRRRISGAPSLRGWTPESSQRVQSGFYISHALEVVRQ